MDFRDKLPFKVLNKLLKTKFSIRLSVLSIILLLLIGVSTLIISINYFAINSILVASAKDSLFHSSGKIAKQIEGYLRPLNANIKTAYRMFLTNVVNPKDDNFTRFLYGLIKDNENLVAAYWCDVKGNTYWLNRKKNDFFEEVVLRDSKGSVIQVIRKDMDDHGHVLTTTNIHKSKVTDFRLRPWYLQAKLRKDLTWVVYRLLETDDQKAQYGVTSAFPVYDNKGNLQGVFGIDMLLGVLADYVRAIELTANSFIFIVDINGNTIASHTLKGELLTFDENPDLTDLSKAPWLVRTFELYKNEKKQGSPFVYSVHGKEYIAAYNMIADVKSDVPWFVGIVTPINDIIDPLRKYVLVSTIFVGIVLLLGIILALIFASSLSRPITRLAQDANLICQLRLESITHLFSRIKEIDNMTDAFIKMKNALYSFQRYMPIALVKKLIISNKVATVGGEAKDLTLFFTDIQDFTKLSEGFDPKELMQHLSEYFQIITEIIIEMHGTVDKYVGDGVMAFWGAPIDDVDHVKHACRAALRAHKVLQQQNLKWQREGKPALITRFGLNTGRVIVGNVGSDDRLSYTSLGDPVNLASRLEELNKAYDTTIMVSEFVYEKAKYQFEFRFLDRVAIRGKKQRIYVYELLGEKGSKLGLVWEQYDKEFRRAFSSYERGDWQTALNLFEGLSKKYPDDKVVKIFIARCTELISNPPSNWDGVWIKGD